MANRTKVYPEWVEKCRGPGRPVWDYALEIRSPSDTHICPRSPEKGRRIYTA